MPQHIDPQHNATRTFLRVLGPGVVFVGLIFTIIGLGSFFASFGTFGPPRYFWCAFLGLPPLGLGGAICKFAFMGAIGRYMANEVAPVGKDVANYMAGGTRGAVRTWASALGKGLRAGLTPMPVQGVRCHKCTAENDAAANFCKSCGAALTTFTTCTRCGEHNAPDARFCDNCGHDLA
jgi:hypothetical protein